MTVDVDHLRKLLESATPGPLFDADDGTNVPRPSHLHELFVSVEAAPRPA